MGEVLGRYYSRDMALPDNHPWNTLPVSDVASLLERATPMVLARGHRIKSELGIVISGAVAVECELFDGRRVLCTLFHQGNLVDLRRTKRNRQGQLIALKRSIFIALDERQFAVCATDHATAFFVQLRELTARMRDHAADLVSKTPLEKLASVLFEFTRWPGAVLNDNEPNMIRMPICRSDIADYIGVKPETVSRAIRQLERECIIEILDKNRIVLCDIPSMRRIANGGRPRRSTRR